MKGFIYMCMFIHTQPGAVAHRGVPHTHVDGGNRRLGSPPSVTPTFGNGRMRSPYEAERINRSELMLGKGWLLALSHTCVKHVPTFPAWEGRALWS